MFCNCAYVIISLFLRSTVCFISLVTQCLVDNEGQDVCKMERTWYRMILHKLFSNPIYLSWRADYLYDISYRIL